ncbi:MAG: T9SS type A sorting domain-containing protein [Bacteroidota bacterium]
MNFLKFLGLLTACSFFQSLSAQSFDYTFALDSSFSSITSVAELSDGTIVVAGTRPTPGGAVDDLDMVWAKLSLMGDSLSYNTHALPSTASSLKTFSVNDKVDSTRFHLINNQYRYSINIAGDTIDDQNALQVGAWTSTQMRADRVQPVHLGFIARGHNLFTNDNETVYFSLESGLIPYNAQRFPITGAYAETDNDSTITLAWLRSFTLGLYSSSDYIFGLNDNVFQTSLQNSEGYPFSMVYHKGAIYVVEISSARYKVNLIKVDALTGNQLWKRNVVTADSGDYKNYLFQPRISATAAGIVLIGSAEAPNGSGVHLLPKRIIITDTSGIVLNDVTMSKDEGGYLTDIVKTKDGGAVVAWGTRVVKISPSGEVPSAFPTSVTETRIPSAVSVYPNPVVRGSNLHVKTSSIISGEVQLISLLGRVILSQSFTKTDTEMKIPLDLPTGMYIVRVVSPQGVSNRRIFIE